MILKELLDEKNRLEIEFDNKIPRIAFYQYGEEISSSTIEPLKTKLSSFLKNIDLIYESKNVKK